MPLKKLRDIIGNKATEEPKTFSDNGHQELSETERKRTYFESGYGAAKNNNGHLTGLKINLNDIYDKFQNEEKQNQQKQNELKEPYFKEKAIKETELKAKNVILENTNEKITSKKENINILKNEIAEIPDNPEKYGIEASKGSSVKFWIGVLLLVPITAYLIVFYMSASYSAFFKDWNPNDSVFQSILDPQAFNKAWAASALEGLFITLIPFVFMGLGYLIHMFGENKSIANKGKVSLLILVTFAFDVILAYLIDKQIYDLNKTLNSPDFNLGIAFQDIQFWGIIFAGFIVYLIWGLVFDFVMKEHKERDKVRMAINERKEKIKNLNEGIDKLEEEKGKLKEIIQTINSRIEELNRLIHSIVIPVKDYKMYASEFTNGYITYINRDIALPREEKDSLVNKCYFIYEEHLNQVEANKDNYNLLYVSKN